MLRNLYFLGWRDGSGVKMPSSLEEDWSSVHIHIILKMKIKIIKICMSAQCLGSNTDTQEACVTLC